MPQLLLEFFSEEIPARMQKRAEEDLARALVDKLKSAGLEAKAVRTFSGPRRLGIVIDDLPVKAADVSEEKISQLQQGRIPIYEPGLEPLVTRNEAEKRLRFTTDVAAAVEASDVVFIAVGTPPDEDGSADLQHVLAVAKTIGDHMNS